MSTHSPANDNQKLPQGPAAWRKLAKALCSATSPLLLVGRGACGQATQRLLLELARHVPRARFASTPGAKGSFPEDHPQAVGVFGFGGHASAAQALQDADIVLVLGSRLLEQSSNGWTAHLNRSHVHRIDRDALRLTATWPEQNPVAAHLPDALRRLLRAVKRETDTADLSPTAAYRPIRVLPRTPGPVEGDRHVHPAALFEVMSRVAGHVPVSADAGNSMCWAIEYLERTQPGCFHLSLDWGTMGFALPAAIGASLASHCKPVIAVTGDGSMAMAGGELHTAAEYDLPVVVVVLNDRGAGMVRAGTAHWFSHQPPLTDLSYRHCLNLAAFARSLGAQGHTITGVPDFERALVHALHQPGPTLLDVFVDPAVEPSAIGSRVHALAEPQPDAGGGLC